MAGADLRQKAAYFYWRASVEPGYHRKNYRAGTLDYTFHHREIPNGLIESLDKIANIATDDTKRFRAIAQRILEDPTDWKEKLRIAFHWLKLAAPENLAEINHPIAQLHFQDPNGDLLDRRGNGYLMIAADNGNSKSMRDLGTRA